MSVSEDERALRRLVADLATRSEHDIAAVLELLEPAHQADVRRLLDAYQGKHLPTVEAGPLPLDADGQAPSWVLERLDAEGGSGISATAREALRSCLADWQSAGQPAVPASGPASGRGPTLLNRARSALPFSRAPR